MFIPPLCPSDNFLSGIIGNSAERRLRLETLIDSVVKEHGAVAEMTFIERLADNLAAGICQAIIFWLISDALFKRRILAAISSFVPKVKQLRERYGQLERAAIDDPRCPIDFYALHFACLIFLSVIGVTLAGDMSNVFFNEDYGWDWYVFLFAAGSPFSYSMGLVVGAVVKVSFQRLDNQKHPDNRCDQCRENRLRRTAPTDQVQDIENGEEQ